MGTQGRVRIGTSGWSYPPWRGVFYPPGLRQQDELAYLSRALGGTIEVDATAKRLQRPAVFERWRDAVPDGFVLALKGSRFVTHMKRLIDVEVPLANFFASGVLCLGDRLGPILWQLPPATRFDEARLAAFFALLPRDTEAAARLASRHDARVPVPWTTPRVDQPLRHALEVRHPSFATPEVVAFLRDQGIALVAADTAGRWPELLDVTADFVYARLHGHERIYQSGYDEAGLDLWARRVRAWTTGREPRGGTRAGPPPEKRPRDVYLYFDNTDVELRAPFDARALAARLGVLQEPPPELAAAAPRTRAATPPAGGSSPASGRRVRGPRSRARRRAAPRDPSLTGRAG